MKKNIIPEIAISLLLIALVLAWLDPFKIWMPDALGMTLLFILALAYISYLIFMWREKANDERENYHRLRASRNAWLVGTLILIIGLIIQAVAHDIDPWITYALVAMILAKVSSRIYQSFKN